MATFTYEQAVTALRNAAEAGDTESAQRLAVIADGLKPKQKNPDRIESGILMGIKDPITAGAQLLPRGLEQVTSLGGLFPNQVSSFFGSEAKRVDEMAKQEEQGYQEARKEQGDTGFDGTRVVGNIISPANMLVASKAAQIAKAAKMAQAGQGVAAGVASGMLNPVTSGDFAEEKVKQAVTGAVGGAVGEKVTKVAGRVLSPLVSKAEQTMREMGVKTTPGQLIGGQAKGIEEFAENLPLVGSYISGAKDRALFSFNKGVINNALKKVDAKLPDDVIGRDAVQFANQVVSDKYDDVLSKIDFTLDFKTQAALNNVVRNAPLPKATQKQAVQDLLDSMLYQKLPVNDKGFAQVSGKEFKLIESDMRKVVNDYLNSSTAEEKQIGKALQGALKAMKDGLRSQHPEQSSALRRVDNAYGDIAVMKTAAANTGASNGVFTPKQYQQAVRMRDTSRNKTSFAAGGARGQKEADAAVEVLGRDPRSTLEGRVATQVTGGMAALANPAIAAPVGIVAPVLYSESGIKVMNALMRSRPEVVKQLGEVLTARASKEGSITGAQVMAEYNRLTKPQ